MERCYICHEEYWPMVWHVRDELWKKITGIPDGSGLLCPRCFSDVAFEEHDIVLYWECEAEEFPTSEERRWRNE